MQPRPLLFLGCLKLLTPLDIWPVFFVYSCQLQMFQYCFSKVFFIFRTFSFPIKISWLIHTHHATHYQTIHITPTSTYNTLTHTAHSGYIHIYIQTHTPNSLTTLPKLPFLPSGLEGIYKINFYSTGFMQFHFSKCNFSLINSAQFVQMFWWNIFEKATSQETISRFLGIT